MEGQRVRRNSPRRNPLYILFLSLIAAIVILLITAISLGLKLGSVQRELRAAKAQLEMIQNASAQQQTADSQPSEVPEKNSEPVKENDMPITDKTKTDEVTQKTDSSTQKTDGKPAETKNSTPAKKTVVDWLDLTGHSELTVLPQKLFRDYAVCYTTDGVNMRSGPSTSYSKITLVEGETQVKAAAKDGEWTFVSVNGKFGWIRSDYLTISIAEATSGNLRTQ